MERYRAIGNELSSHLAAYEDLNARFGVRRHAYWISHPRLGPDLAVSVYEMTRDGLAAMRARVWDRSSAHDRWWLDLVRDVNGIDMLEETPHTAPPEEVWAWEAS